MKFNYTDECEGPCWNDNCKGLLYRLIREGLHRYELSEGRFVEVGNYSTWCCDVCGEEAVDAEQCKIKEAAITKKYPNYFRK